MLETIIYCMYMHVCRCLFSEEQFTEAMCMLTCVVEKLKLYTCKQFHIRTEHMYLHTAVKPNHHMVKHPLTVLLVVLVENILHYSNNFQCNKIKK